MCYKCLTAKVLFCIEEGQPDSIVQDIENMVRSYIEKVSIINIENCFLS